MNNSYVVVIAEAGVNHDGSLQTALDLVDAAAEVGADVVKFQTFKAAELASTLAPKPAYQIRRTGNEESQLEMLRRLELSVEAHRAIIARCAEKRIGFLSSVFDHNSLTLLADEFRLQDLKFGSGELTNAPLLLAAARTGCRLILSTGMGTLAEVEEALSVIAFGFTAGINATPRPTAFAATLTQPATWDALRSRVILLHCTTDYPAAPIDVNLRAMETMRNAFGLKVGYSDHTEGTAISIAAVAQGAVMIEKHLTLDRTSPGPDHAASLEPSEFRDLVRAIRDVQAAMGNGIKKPSEAEGANRVVTRKSLVAACAVSKGQKFTAENVAVKRPGSGRTPTQYWSTIGTPADRDYAAGEPLDP
jgi:N-acetylneuraminate synthase